MRIGITGAQSVGKTTLLNALRSEKFFKDYAICDEVTRRVRSYGIPINEQGTSVTQRLIMNEHIVNIFMHEKMLTDRTALDGLVYTLYLHKKGNIDSKTLLYVEDVFKRLIKSYDHIFYIEPEFDIVDDGERSIDKEFRDEIVELFDSVMKRYKISTIKIKGSVRDRVNMVIEILEGR
jgi:nicotinamide riboside kinase